MWRLASKPILLTEPNTVAKYRVTQKKRKLLKKNPTKIEEIQERKIIDRN